MDTMTQAWAIEGLKQYGFHIERTAKRIRQKMQRKLNAENCGITVDQWVILDTLYENDGMSQYEIADKTYKDAPTVTRIIDLLCKKELAQRVVDENDRRRFNIFLTDEGKEKVLEVLPYIREIRQLGWDGLDQDDYQSLMRIVSIIFKNLE